MFVSGVSNYTSNFDRASLQYSSVRVIAHGLQKGICQSYTRGVLRKFLGKLRNMTEL